MLNLYLQNQCLILIQFQTIMYLYTYELITTVNFILFLYFFLFDYQCFNIYLMMMNYMDLDFLNIRYLCDAEEIEY